ncbi:hypothetical protein Mycsm_07267 (plasmid) [Mycobacterium sp. JS623]|uniref:DUF4192 domain-containing protein n=1 Tax=Mycobacterium sp. JS623 TaxID=212767 RepID=UPI0002A57CEB|nr:DUF4192 domain-containing protein [Mycobacterium sp. JS623]AGB27361.1 hypothetical protein Mycsm_07267 [Mycobacterium sp. JS623]
MHAIKALGSVIANLVAILGFQPFESLVLVTVTGDALGCVLRLDLTDAALPEAPERLADTTARSGAEGVAAVFVSAEGASCAMCAGEYRDMVGELAAALNRRGVQMLDAVVVDRIEVGGRWTCLDECGNGGVLDDPAASVAAAAAVVAGHRLYGSREELKASVAVDRARVAELAPLLVGAGGPVEDVAVAVREVVTAVRRVGEGVVLSDVELARIGAALVDLRVRDAAMTLVHCEDEAAPAEQLWSELARVLPPPFRVEAMCTAAHAAYVRGEGPLAGVRLEALLAEDPAHRMAVMLDKALQSGMPPEAIRGLTANLTPAVSV